MFNTQICDAINNRNLLSFDYENFYRVVEPFTFGKTEKGNIVLSAYQIQGNAHRNSVPCWGLFNLNKISNLQILSENFSVNRYGYRKNDSRMAHIYCQI